MSLEQFFPPLEITLQLEQEELAIPLLKCLIQSQESASGDLNLHNFVISGDLHKYAGEEYKTLAAIITESWIWLENELMLAPTPGKERQWLYVTEKGKKLASESNITRYRAAQIIPPNSLDPILATKVMPLFIRGDYDIAVFQAFKEVEIRVRTAASLPTELVGVDLMRTAFNLDEGVLTDYSQPRAEREATSHLFAGAIGLFKNPSSHRDVDWEDPGACAELIYLANHLLRIVEKHKQTESSG